jgi:hypothetical protein
LTAITAGSTTLVATYGEPDVLPVDIGYEMETAERFWDILVGIGANHPPAWVPPLVAESAARLCAALADAAPTVEISQPHRSRRLTLASSALDRDVWRRVAESAGEHTVVGRLEAVDLKARRFRIRDDVGNAIGLDDVVDADEAGQLVGKRASATGTGITDERGHLRLRDVVVVASPLPTAWSLPASGDVPTLIAASPGPGPAGLGGLTRDESDAFFTALHAG